MMRKSMDLKHPEDLGPGPPFLARLQPPDREKATELFGTLEMELSEVLLLYWSVASSILKGSGIRLLDPPPGLLTLEKNFFSALFLYSYHRAGVAPSRRILYAAINQCLRGMVTGCDNLLDGEYKPTLSTSLPTTGVKFRSVLDIMVSDRILFEILLRGLRENGATPDQILTASSATLRALTRSGAQEAGEEGGTREILAPERILSSIHHEKTGLLFQCVWAVPQLMEKLRESDFLPYKEALYWIGMGCQIMDDMVDLTADIRNRRHNYLLSLICHGEDQRERSRLKLLLRSYVRERMDTDKPKNLLLRFPQARRTAARLARDYLQRGLGTLFPQELQFLVPPVIEKLANLIRADRFLLEGSSS